MNEHPIPSTSLSDDDGGDDEPEIEPNDGGPYIEPNDGGVDNEVNDDDGNIELSNGDVDIEPNNDGTGQAAEVDENADVKQTFDDVVVADHDLNAIRDIELACDAPDVDMEEIHVKVDGIEFIYKSESDFIPIQINDGYIIKPNDVLSNSWPFKENVSIQL